MVSMVSKRLVPALLSFLTGFSPLVIPVAVHAAELAEIKQRGRLIVGVKDNVPPLGFRQDDGQLAGFEIDLAHYLAETLLGDANAVTLQPLANQERLSALLDGDVDLVIARLTTTGSRARLVDFSTPYYLDGTGLITRSPAIQTPADLQQAPIAVLRGSSTIAVIRSRWPQARLVAVTSYQEAKALLEAGQAAAFAADVSVLTGWVQEDPAYHLLPQRLSTEALAVALPRGLQYDELRRQVDAAIDHWRLEGALREQVLQWGLPEAGVPGQAERSLLRQQDQQESPTQVEGGSQ